MLLQAFTKYIMYLFPHNNFSQSITHHSSFSYSNKSMRFDIQEELKLIFLDNKFWSFFKQQLILELAVINSRGDCYY